MDMKSIQEWSEDLELIICVEEKRKLIEVQVKEAIFDDRRGRQCRALADQLRFRLANE